MKATYCLLLIVIYATFSTVESGVYSPSSRQKYEAENQKENNSNVPARYSKNKSAETETSGSVSSSPKRLISAWGIIAIILGVIILSTITYYVFILYPYICYKDQAYDTIELTEVNSVSNVSDNTNNMLPYRNSNDTS